MLQNGKYTDMADSCTQCDFEEPPSETEEETYEDLCFQERSLSLERIEYTSHLQDEKRFDC